MFYSETGTFFTLVGKLRLALNEMFEVSALSMREVPYEEYSPITKKLKEGSSYLFKNLKEGSIVGCKAASQDDIEQCITETGDVSYTIESDESGFKAGTTFKSFHYQPRFHVSNQGPIAGFLMLWLKRCVIPSLPKDVIAINVVYPAILLLYGHLGFFRLWSAIFRADYRRYMLIS